MNIIRFGDQTLMPQNDLDVISSYDRLNWERFEGIWQNMKYFTCWLNTFAIFFSLSTRIFTFSYLQTFFHIFFLNFEDAVYFFLSLNFDDVIEIFFYIWRLLYQWSNTFHNRLNTSGHLKILSHSVAQ